MIAAEERSGPEGSTGWSEGVPTFVPGDVLRWAALVSVVIGFVGWGWVGGALFFLVLGGSVIPRALGVSTALDLSFTGFVLFAGWAAQLDFYLEVSWLDIAAHFVVTGLVAVMVQLVLVRIGALPSHDDDRLPRARLGSGVLTLVLGTSLAVLWEMCEWFGHTQLDDRIQVGYSDTMGDLAAGALGSALAGVLVARGLLTRARQ